MKFVLILNINVFILIAGSHGVFVEVTVGDKNIVDFFTKLGFLEIAHPGFHTDDVFYMGRTF